MNQISYKLVLVFVIVILTNTCQAQDNIINENLQINECRAPVVSGLFYPEDSAGLSDLLVSMFKNAEQEKYKNIRAIVVPHAGYSYSGSIAASGYSQLVGEQKFENVFILASSHKAYYQGVSVYSPGNYLTPLGEVEVNLGIVNQLCEENTLFDFVPKAHINEHSIEVQLPFLQHVYGKDLKIVPLVIGSQSASDSKQISKVLEPYFIPENLFVISSDFSHYPSYQDAVAWDGKTADAILLNSSKEFIAAINDHLDDQVENLVTRACGWTSLLTLLYLSENKSDLEYHEVIYRNSGDAFEGNKQKVVGYFSFVLSKSDSPNKNPGSFFLSDNDKAELLRIARQAITYTLDTVEVLGIEGDNYSSILNDHFGAFVSLYKNGQLRGCIGNFGTDDPLYDVVCKIAIASATEDPRFKPVQYNELNQIEIEISVLSHLKRIYSIDEIELGRHGIYIKKGYSTGTFLPQVATETNWSKEEFLGHCSRDKAGIGYDGWKDAEIYTYEAIVFSE